ncbi:MAG: carbon-nitrogen hydrolase family protein [Caulobacterales bacterium]|nr:carbon-nitrogen hydrolase family protein [Caulobacterales bacterium]
MTGPVRVGLVQMRGGVDPAANAEAAAAAVREAAAKGARFIATPEATNIVQRDGEALSAAVTGIEDDPAARVLAALSGELGVWVLAGSLMTRAEDGRVANRSVLFDPQGRVHAAYDKIHLFDVAFGDGEAYAESATVAPGREGVVADLSFARLGLSVCYDVRFPHLYRALAKAGADIIAVPAAFTRRTGEAHWEVLLRARAVEAGAFVLAPAQGGSHDDGRRTWGRTMAVGPWGEVLGVLDHDEPGVLTVDLDLAAVAAARAKIPSLRHDRDFRAPAAAP